MRHLMKRSAADSLQCCTAALQVAALTVGQEHNRHFDQMFKVWVNMLVGIIPQNTDIGRAYEGATSAEDQDFVQNLALFLTAFFKVETLTTCKAPSYLSHVHTRVTQSILRARDWCQKCH